MHCVLRLFPVFSFGLFRSGGATATNTTTSSCNFSIFRCFGSFRACLACAWLGSHFLNRRWAAARPPWPAIHCIMDDDPAARVNRARSLFRKVHVAEGKSALMGVHEFGTYATAAGFKVSMTDLVRARMALDPNGEQSVDPESFFTWLYSMLKSKKKSHLNKILTRTLIGTQTISNRDLPGEAHAYGKPVIRDGGSAANTMVETGNEFNPSKERKPDRDWEALNRNFDKSRLIRRGGTTALDLKAITKHDKQNMQYVLETHNDHDTYLLSRLLLFSRSTTVTVHIGW